MATATSSALPLNTNTGRSVVTLTSYAGPITWTTAPVSGDQIEFPDAITVGVDGQISGAAGTYTVRHIVATTGTTQAVSYVLSAGNNASVGIELVTDNVDSLNYVTLTSYSGPITFPTTPVAGDQIVFPIGVTIDETGAVTAPTATYTVYHIAASTGVFEAVSYAHSAGANTAPVFSTLPDVVANIGDVASISVAAFDPDTGDVLTYSHDVLPGGLSRTGDSVTGTYTTEETVLTTFGVQDDSGDTGNDSDSAQVLFSVARAGYTITTLAVNYAGLNPDSPLVAAITDSDLTVGDQVDYPQTQTDQGGDTRTLTFADDGLLTAAGGTRSLFIDDVYIRDSSNSYTRVGPFDITLVGTGPVLTAALTVVSSSETTSGGQLNFTADESGNYRLIVVTSGFGTPTADQVFAGLGPDGNAPLFDSGLTAQTATVSETVTVTGLPTAGAGYWCFLALEDQYGGLTLAGPTTLSTLAVGQPPVWAAIPNQAWSEGTAVSLDFRTYATDAVSFSISGLPVGTGLTLNPTTGVLSGTPNQIDASGVPGSTTTYTLIATATNATGSSNQSFLAGVYRLNPPTNTGVIAAQSWKETIAVNLSLSSFISGATSYQIEYDNSGTFEDATASLTGYGITFNSSTGQISGAPNAFMPLDSPIDYRVRGVNADGDGDWLAFTASIAALAPPVFSGPIPAQSLSQGTAFSFDLGVYFSNFDSISGSGLPVGTGLTLSSLGVLSGTPLAVDVSASPITLTLTATNTDGTAQGTVTLNVAAASLPILIASFPDLSYSIGSAVNINFDSYITNASSYTVSGLPSGTGTTILSNGLGGTWAQEDSDASPYVIVVTGINDNGQVQDAFQLSSLAAPSPIVRIYDPYAEIDKFHGDKFRARVKAGGSNWTQIQLYNDGSPHLLNNYTELRVQFSDGTNTYTGSSLTSPEFFDVSPGEGKFNVRLGRFNVPAGIYLTDVYYFDLEHSNGVLFTDDRNFVVTVL